MGREVTEKYEFRMLAVKWVGAKLQGDKIDSVCRKVSGRDVME